MYSRFLVGKLVWQKLYLELTLAMMVASVALGRAANFISNRRERLATDPRTRRFMHFLGTPVDMKMIRRIFRPRYKGQRFLPNARYPGSLWPSSRQRGR